MREGKKQKKPQTESNIFFFFWFYRFTMLCEVIFVLIFILNSLTNDEEYNRGKERDSVNERYEDQKKTSCACGD